MSPLCYLPFGLCRADNIPCTLIGKPSKRPGILCWTRCSSQPVSRHPCQNLSKCYVICRLLKPSARGEGVIDPITNLFVHPNINKQNFTPTSPYSGWQTFESHDLRASRNNCSHQIWDKSLLHVTHLIISVRVKTLSNEYKQSFQSKMSVF
jgi:hypothetical protein